MNVTRILCPSPLSATLLQTAVDQEGHAATWYRAGNHCVVLAVAPQETLVQCARLVTTMLQAGMAAGAQ